VREVRLNKQAEKYYLAQDSIARKRIKTALVGLGEIPPKGDVIPVQGIPDTFRLRLGGYRLLFSIDDRVVIVTKIQPRGQVYKKL